MKKKNISPPVGFEPTTFWLTARRYNHLATEALVNVKSIVLELILCKNSLEYLFWFWFVYIEHFFYLLDIVALMSSNIR